MKWMIQKFQEDILRLQLSQSFTSLLMGICWIKVVLFPGTWSLSVPKLPWALQTSVPWNARSSHPQRFPNPTLGSCLAKITGFFFEVCWSQWKRQFKSAENLSGGRLNLGRSFTFSCYFLRCCSTFSRVFDKDGKCLPHFGFINISRVPGDLFSSNSSSGWLWELALPPSFTTLAARY